jgi:hypothetical protein
VDCCNQAITLIVPFAAVTELRQRFKGDEHPLRRFDYSSSRLKPSRILLTYGAAEAALFQNRGRNPRIEARTKFENRTRSKSENTDEANSLPKSAELAAAIAGTGDKVQVLRAAGAMQTAGHDKYQGIGSIVPALAKNARAGHPQFLNGKQTSQNSGPPAHLCWQKSNGPTRL